MTWGRTGLDWDEIRKRLKARWDRLDDEGLDAIAGERALLLTRLRELYSLTEAGAEHELRDWERHQEPFEPRGR